VIYAPNGASAGVEPAPVTFTYGTTLTVARNTGQLEKPGYTFGGWSTAPDGTGVTFEPEAANVALSNDTVLFARWVSAASAPISNGTPNSPPTSPIQIITAKSPKVLTVSGFKDGSALLTKSMQSRIDAFLSKYSGYKKLTVAGYTEGPTILKSDRALSSRRASAARTYIKSFLKYEAQMVTIIGSTSKIKSSSLRKVKITLSD
jgi:uncharacterized repeat protein (TIGR02543 family)